MQQVVIRKYGMVCFNILADHPYYYYKYPLHIVYHNNEWRRSFNENKIRIVSLFKYGFTSISEVLEPEVLERYYTHLRGD